MSEQPMALAPIEAEAVGVAPLNPEQLAQAFALYRELQAVIDRAMPDQLVKIGESYHRKRGAWLAIALARHVSVEVIAERREVFDQFDDGRDNFGWIVAARATAGGRSMTGDGACFASEKAEAFRCPHPHPSWEGKTLHYPGETCPDYDPAYRWRFLPTQATEHNVHAHAATRAVNRAISNLVAFGEVSAEEMEAPPDDERRRGGGGGAARSGRGPDTRTISEAQRKRLWVIAKRAGWEEHEVKSMLGMRGFEHTADVTRDKYEAICELLEAGVDGTRESREAQP